MEINQFHRTDFFLAAIVAAVERTQAKNPKQVKTENYLIKFRTKDEMIKARTLEERTESARTYVNLLIAQARARLRAEKQGHDRIASRTAAASKSKTVAKRPRVTRK